MNFAELDQQRRYTYRVDRLKKARALGYDYISEATCSIYRASDSLIATAYILGLSITGVREELKDMGVKLNPRGGKNNIKGGL